jgi:hypothetical protein
MGDCVWGREPPLTGSLMLDAVALHSAPIMEFTTSAFAPKAEVYPCRRYFRKYHERPSDERGQ